MTSPAKPPLQTRLDLSRPGDATASRRIDPASGRGSRLTTPQSLIDAGLADPERLAEMEAVAERYAVGLTPALARLIDRNDPEDPIARQFVPDGRELRRDPEEIDDPIGDDAKSPVEGLVHRYPDRVLLKLVSVCAVYCRFCFRRERIGPGSGSLSAAAFAAALEYVRARPAIWEVILTGGDPLTASPRRIAEVTRSLAAIGHVKTLRWHTRLPVAAPERVTLAMARALDADGKTIVVAVHANHPRELTAEARAACRRLADRGILLVSQTVLLKGVNDDVEVPRLDARLRRSADQAVLPAPRRPRARHRPLADLDRQRPGADAGLARPAVGARGAELLCSTFPAVTARSRSGRSRSGRTGSAAGCLSTQAEPSAPTATAFQTEGSLAGVHERACWIEAAVPCVDPFVPGASTA